MLTQPLNPSSDTFKSLVTVPCDYLCMPNYPTTAFPHLSPAPEQPALPHRPLCQFVCSQSFVSLGYLDLGTCEGLPAPLLHSPFPPSPWPPLYCPKLVAEYSELPLQFVNGLTEWCAYGCGLFSWHQYDAVLKFEGYWLWLHWSWASSTCCEYAASSVQSMRQGSPHVPEQSVGRCWRDVEELP